MHGGTYVHLNIPHHAAGEFTEGLNGYDEDSLYDNLEYFMIPHKIRLEYLKISQIENQRYNDLR
jgi:hypothetical protein